MEAFSRPYFILGTLSAINTNMNSKKLINLASILIGLAGIFGMLFCFPFLWSANMADLVGAGFPFVGGALLVGTALISLSINNKK